MAKENLTKQANFDVSARELDFVTRFGKNWEALRNILGIMRPIKKVPGTRLVSYKTTVDLQPGNVGEGEEIPYSEAHVEEVAYGDVTIEKFSKGVSIEAVNKYGADVAIQRTDDEFLNQLTIQVLTKFYTMLNSGTLTGAEKSFQMGLAMAKGKVLDKFASIDRTVTEVVGFCNILDVYEYIGTAGITIQSQFGINYVKDFMGYSTLFLLPEKYIAGGRVIAVPVENIDLYYADPSDSDFARLGLVFRTDGETNLIGFHAEGNYKTAVGDSFAIYGMTLWAEYLDGIAVIDIDDSTFTDLTVAADAPDATYPWTSKTPSDFQSNVTVSGDKITGTLTFIEGGLATSGPLAGDGYFLALKFDNFSSGLTYANVKVGLNPSEGTGLVTLDSDKNAVFKIADKDVQKIETIQSDGTHRNIQYFDLSGLTLQGTGA